MHPSRPRRKTAYELKRTFAEAHDQWLTVRRDMDLLNGSDSDAKWDKLFDTLNAATWAMIQKPASGIAEIRARAAVLQHECERCMRAGRPTDARLPMMAAQLAAELEALRVPPDPDAA